MGKKGVEIAQKGGINVKELIKKLNKAYADEWLAYIQYWTGAQVIEGFMRPDVQKELMEHANEELGHAQKLSDRIIQLGGSPLLDPKDFFKETNCGYLTPKDYDVKSLLKQNISGERCAISVYNDILNYVRLGKDPITFHIIRGILEDEVEHEQDLEDLQKDVNSK
jgi:bacterioferritin